MTETIQQKVLTQLNKQYTKENKSMVEELMRKSDSIIEAIQTMEKTYPEFDIDRYTADLAAILLTGKSELSISVPESLRNPGIGGMFSGLSTFFEKQFGPFHKAIQSTQGQTMMDDLLRSMIQTVLNY